MQLVVLAISLAVMALIALSFISAARAAALPEVAPGTDPETRRRRIILGLAAFGLIVTVLSLRPWPHAIPGTAAVINVSGGQFYWEIDTDTVPLGEPVAFHAHTVDVTHGFGVMDAGGTILFQSQAMPGYVNRVSHTFETPGTYRVVCLEYCGIAHHDMLNEFTVAAR